MKSTYGVTIRVDRLLEDVDPDEYDALAIPGGFEEYGFYQDAYRNEAAELIRAFFEAGKPIASVCVGCTGTWKQRCAQRQDSNDLCFEWRP